VDKQKEKKLAAAKAEAKAKASEAKAAADKATADKIAASNAKKDAANSAAKEKAATAKAKAAEKAAAKVPEDAAAQATAKAEAAGLFPARVVERQPVTGRYLLEYIEDESQVWVCRSEIATTLDEIDMLARVEIENGVAPDRITKRVQSGTSSNNPTTEKLPKNFTPLTEVGVSRKDGDTNWFGRKDDATIAGTIISTSSDSPLSYTIRYTDDVWRTRPVRNALEKVELSVDLKPYSRSSHHTFLP
jgi:hypothetical protein